MTISIIDYCTETSAVGGSICISNIAVGGRCIRLAYGQDAFLSQHRTDPRLGDLGRTILNGRGGAKEAL